MTNQEVAQVLSRMADILEIKGENPFRIRAFRKAIQALESLTEEVAEVLKRGELAGIPGIGSGIAGRIEELQKTGHLREYEKLQKEVPAGLLLMLAIPEVGPKTVQLFQKHKVTSIRALEKACRGGKLRGLPGIRARTEENILRGIEFLKKGEGRLTLGEAYPLAEQIMEALRKKVSLERMGPAGSLRRMQETIGDVDLLVVSKQPQMVMKIFTALPGVTRVLARGKTKSSVVFNDRFQVDMRVVEKGSFGAALQYFTGSKQHNVKLRELAGRKGLKINEYGVFRLKDEKQIAGREEEEIYKVLGLPWMPPEIREDRGEIEAAGKGALPSLLEEKDVRGDLHVHSDWTDGSASISEMVKAARKEGFRYIAICDHSRSLGVASGLSEKELLKQIEEIGELNRKLRGFRILAGSEVDILADGKLDFPGRLLAKLDLVVASIHSRFKQSREEMTKRIVKAMEDPCVHILGHPTGRLLGGRPAYEVDLEEVMKAAARTGTAVELNSQPDRLDIDDIHCRRAKELGVKISLGTDAHYVHQFRFLKYGVGTARRGWLGKQDVLNSLPAQKLLAHLDKKKGRLRKG